MKNSTPIFLILTLFWGCNSTNNINISNLTPTQRIALNTHNQLRQKHFTDAPLHYSLKLEYDAQQFANYLAKEGLFEHDPNNLSKKYGENLYAFSANSKPDLSKIIQKWYNENIYYNPQTKQCKRGKMCGHYTQVVWKDSKLLGCASAQYQRGRFKGGYVTVCKYYPYGNIIGHSPF